jgi:hypothetical protein
MLDFKFSLPTMRSIYLTGIWRRVDLYCVPLQCLLFSYCFWPIIRPQRWRQFVPPKRRYYSTRLHGVTYPENSGAL